MNKSVDVALRPVHTCFHLTTLYLGLLLLSLTACSTRVETPHELTIKPASVLSAESRAQNQCLERGICDDLAALQRQIYVAYRCHCIGTDCRSW